VIQQSIQNKINVEIYSGSTAISNRKEEDVIENYKSPSSRKNYNILPKRQSNDPAQADQAKTPASFNFLVRWISASLG